MHGQHFKNILIVHWVIPRGWWVLCKTLFYLYKEELKLFFRYLHKLLNVDDVKVQLTLRIEQIVYLKKTDEIIFNQQVGVSAAAV